MVEEEAVEKEEEEEGDDCPHEREPRPRAAAGRARRPLTSLVSRMVASRHVASSMVGKRSSGALCTLACSG